MTLFSRLKQSKSSLSLSAFQKWFQNPKFDHFFRAGELGLSLNHPLQFYSILRNAFDHNDSLMTSLYIDPPSRWKNAASTSLAPYYDNNETDILNAILKLEFRTKLTNDFLLTEDRVSMANSLEVRVPFLDHDVVNFAFSMPSEFKYRYQNKKRILRDAVEDWIPPEVLHKKKWGFSVNPYLLFDKELKAFASEILTEASVKSLGLFNWKWIQQILDTPAHPRLRWHYFTLWTMAGMTLWHQMFFKTTHAKRL